MDYKLYIWAYFMIMIDNEYGVAGLMGNLYAESGLIPNKVQNIPSASSDSDAYTQAVDDGTKTEYEFVHDSVGYGLAQWTYYTRKQALYDMYKSGGYSTIGSIELQCEYLAYELEHGYPSVLEALKNATSVREASDYVLHNFEQPANQSTAVEIKRANYGIKIYNEMTGTGTELPEVKPEVTAKKKKFKFLLMTANKRRLTWKSRNF